MDGRGMKPVVSFKFRFLQHNLWVFPCRHWEKQHISSLLSPELMIAIWRRTLAACLACNGNKEGFLGWLCGICRTSGAICFAIQVPEELHMQAVKAKTAALVPLWQSKYVTSTFWASQNYFVILVLLLSEIQACDCCYNPQWQINMWW